MANKVLSIKMDERDIEKLKKYYEALIQSGFLTSEKMSLNAFYKHLLLDYLEEDVSRAFNTYSNYGISPTCINPERLNRTEGLTLMNEYGLDAEMFDIYQQCVKEAISRSVERMKSNAELFNEIFEAKVAVTGGTFYKMEYFQDIEQDEQYASFWDMKAFEIMDLQEKAYRESHLEGEIKMIEESSVSDEFKQELISKIKEYDKKRKQNYRIMQGREME